MASFPPSSWSPPTLPPPLPDPRRDHRAWAPSAFWSPFAYAIYPIYDGLGGTDQDLLTDLQYALVEPPNGGASWPSGLWTRDEVLHALNTRLRQLLRDTHLVATRTVIEVLSALNVDNPVALPTNWIATLHLVWVMSDGTRVPLRPVDAYEADLLLPTWQAVRGTPMVYLDGDQGTLTIRLAPLPDADGELDLLYVAQPLPATGHGTVLLVPPEWLDGVKYGTLADLLSKVGRATDPGRAQYCEERFGLTKAVSEIILGGWP